MNSDWDLQKVIDLYTNRGYQVVVRPGPEDLPDFAKDFRMDLVCKRGNEGVLVQVKQNLDDMAADGDMPRYAEITGGQPGWRYDFAILHSQDRDARELKDAREPSEDQLDELLADADLLASQGHLNAALISAWAGLEAVMRKRLRAAGEKTDGESSPRHLLLALYTIGILSAEELARLEQGVRWRKEFVHGFAPARVDPEFLRSVMDTARRLVAESREAREPVEARGA